MQNTSHSKKSYILLISSMTIMGTIGLFRRYIPFSSALLAFFRGLIGALSLCLFLLFRGEKGTQRPSQSKLLGLILNGAFLGLNWILLFEAYNYTTIATATLCYYTQPTIVLLLAPFVFGEKLTVKKLLCALGAIIGMVFLSGVTIYGSNDLSGILFGLAAAVFYALVVILNKKLGSVDVYERTIVQLFSASLVLVPYLLFTEDITSLAFTPQVILLLLVVGVVHTGVVYAMYFGSISALKAQTISVLSYIDPVVALFISVLILREPFSVRSMLGAVLILASAIISELPEHRK